MGFARYLVGDSRKISRILENTPRKPDLIISSPPYSDIKNYEDHPEQIGYGQKYESYLDDVARVFQGCYDISSSAATFWMIVDSVKTEHKDVKPLPFDISNRLNKNSSETWRLRDVIIWNKQKNVPWYGRGHLKNHFEYVLFFTKGDDYKFHIDEIREIHDLKKWWLTYPERYSPEGVSPPNVWEITTQIKGWGRYNFQHMCPFPFPLVERIVNLASDEGDLVLVPFAGSGSAIAIASVMGRDAIGVDINEKYKEEFNAVLQDAKAYWSRRVKEVDLLKQKLANFKQINIKLRQLKLASAYCNYLDDNFIDRRNLLGYVCIADPSNDHGIRLSAIVAEPLYKKDIKETDD
ncbi:MAG: site-specific DNA-methyltransferase, partial [Candidatus Thorarchaeota archaeon]